MQYGMQLATQKNCDIEFGEDILRNFVARIVAAFARPSKPRLSFPK